MTVEDTRLFQSRVLKMNDIEMKRLKDGEVSLPHLRAVAKGAKPICLFHSNEEVRKTNAAILQRMDTESAISVGFDRVSGAGTNNQSAVKYVLSHVSNDGVHKIDNLSLLKNLHLRVDARYMITANIDTADGLVNGTTGYLKRIDYGTIANSSQTKPLRIWLCFEDQLSGNFLRKNKLS